MPTYKLHYPDSRSHTDIALEFEAQDACQALVVVQEKHDCRRVQLLEEGAPLCELRREEVDSDTIWVVGRPE